MPLIIIEGDDQDQIIELIEKALEKVYGARPVREPIQPDKSLQGEITEKL